MTEPPPLARSAGPVLVAGVGWAVLSAWLAIDGHAPAVTWVGIPRDAYYAAQAAFVVPLLIVQWLVLSGVAQLVARAGGGFRGTAARLSPALAYPILGVLVMPDAIVYAAFGFPALAQTVRVTTPLLALTTWAAATFALRGAGVPVVRALPAALLGLLAQAAVGAPFLR